MYRRTVAVGTIALVATVGALAPAATADAQSKHHETKVVKKAKKAKAQPWIGSTVTVENQDKQYERVTLVGITDPAQGADQYTTPDAGKRFVAVTLQIKNTSKGTDQNSADDNTTIIGTNKQAYTSDLNSLAGCTDFEDGQYTLAQGAEEVGCVAFQLPTGVNVAKVEYNPNAGFSTNTAWFTAP